MNLNLVEIGKKLQLTLNLAVEGSNVRLLAPPKLTINTGPGPRDFSATVITSDPEAGIYVKWWWSNVNGPGTNTMKLGNPLQSDSGSLILTDSPGLSLYNSGSYISSTVTAPLGYDYVYFKAWTLDDNTSTFNGQEAGWIQVSSSSSGSSTSGVGGSTSGGGSASGGGSTSGGGSASGGASTSGDPTSGGSASGGSTGGSTAGSSSLPPGSSASS